MILKIVSIVTIGQYMFGLSTTLKCLKTVTYSVIIFVKKNYWNDQLGSVFIVFGLILYSYCLGSRETAILAVSGGGTVCCGASAFYTSPRGLSTAHALSQRTPDLVAQRLSQPLSPRALVPLPLDPHSPITYFPHATSCLRQCHHQSLSVSLKNLFRFCIRVWRCNLQPSFLACFFQLQLEPCVFNSH